MPMRTLMALLLLTGTAVAQQQPMVPLTGWRAQIDVDLGKVAMTREAHGQVISILQAYERAAQAVKEPPKHD